jgi:hypothetical protein
MFMSPEDMEHHRQLHKAAAHEINTLMNTLSEGDLRVLGQILDGIVMSDEPLKLAAYMGGRVTAVMEYRFGECSACGEKHDDELKELVEDSKSQRTVPVPPGVAMRRSRFTEIGSRAPITPYEQDLMDQYNLDDVRDGDTNQLLRFVCKNCEMSYATISDRMIEQPGPGGCDGCIQKTKWG